MLLICFYDLNHLYKFTSFKLKSLVVIKSIKIYIVPFSLRIKVLPKSFHPSLCKVTCCMKLVPLVHVRFYQSCCPSLFIWNYWWGICPFTTISTLTPIIYYLSTCVHVEDGKATSGRKVSNKSKHHNGPVGGVLVSLNEEGEEEHDPSDDGAHHVGILPPHLQGQHHGQGLGGEVQDGPDDEV